jgi:hypothetical protein
VGDSESVCVQRWSTVDVWRFLKDLVRVLEFQYPNQGYKSALDAEIITTRKQINSKIVRISISLIPNFQLLIKIFK